MAKSVPPAERGSGEPRQLLARILATPHLAQVVPQLQPELFHRIIQTCGLEDCGELVAHATADQLTRVFDLDLWRSGQPGADAQFDAERFGVWLEVLLESGESFAAKTLAEMDVHLVVAALARHLRVFDPASVGPAVTEHHLVYEIGGYALVPRRTASWDAIAAVLICLDAEQGEYFHRVMDACRRLSNAGREIDGLDHLLTDGEQVMFDLAVERERRREQQGYLAPAEARAFLQLSRQLPLGPDSVPPDGSLAAAYFRALDAPVEEEQAPITPPPPSDAPASDDGASGVAAVIDVLLDAGVVPGRPQALLHGADGPAPRLARIERCMQVLAERDGAAYSRRNEELAFLANAVLAGCSIQGRSFAPQEAMDAAVAACNLGLENWPPHWVPQQADDILTSRDLVTVFQVGWKVLHEQVCLYSADRLLSVLAGLRSEQHDTAADLNQLRAELARRTREGMPWLAGDAFDALAALDMPAWAALLGLTGECSVMHAAVDAVLTARTRAFSGTAFEFIAENSQLAQVRAFLDALPGMLRG